MGDEPVHIAFFNPFFGDWPSTPEGCSTPATFAMGPAACEGADAVIFHVPTLDLSSLPPKGPGQLWVAWSMESNVTCPVLRLNGFMARFDLTMTYERSSDVWMPYFGPGTVPLLRRPPQEKSAAAPAVYLQSNPHDRSGRQGYAAALMAAVEVDSFGAVLRNRPERIAPGFWARHELYARYKFTLAFENSVAPDYVTEKFYEPLAAGSVPVYRGTPEVADLAPAPGCYIDTRDFGSPGELAAYLCHLDTHDEEYATYHAWRTHPFSLTFEAHLAKLREPELCRLARLVAESRTAGTRTAGSRTAETRTAGTRARS